LRRMINGWAVDDGMEVWCATDGLVGAATNGGCGVRCDGGML